MTRLAFLALLIYSPPGLTFLKKIIGAPPAGDKVSGKSATLFGYVFAATTC